MTGPVPLFHHHRFRFGPFVTYETEYVDPFFSKRFEPHTAAQTVMQLGDPQGSAERTALKIAFGAGSGIRDCYCAIGLNGA